MMRPQSASRGALQVPQLQLQIQFAVDLLALTETLSVPAVLPRCCTVTVAYLFSLLVILPAAATYYTVNISD